MLGYAAVAGVQWCVLTDGNEYRIYNATAAVDAEEKLFRRVRVAEDSPEVVGATLTLVTRANLEENLLDVHWKMHFVDRRCREALKSMIASSDSGLVRLIRKAVDGLSAADVKESLARLEVKIESPPMPLGSPPVAPRQGRSVSRKVEASTNESSDRSAVVEDGSRERIGVSLAQVIGAGLLKAPVCLFRKYKGQRMEAALLADGTVRFNGEVFDSCSRAAD